MHHPFRLAVFTGLIAAAIAGPVAQAADPLEDLRKTVFEKDCPAGAVAPWCEVAKTLAEIEQAQAQADAISGTFNVSFNVNKSNSQDGSQPVQPNTYRIVFSTKLRKGELWSRVAFDADLSVQHRGKVLQEDVSTFRLAYEADLFSGTRWQLRPFTMRSNNSYLSIDQRWEAGLEIAHVWRWGFQPAKGDKLPAFYDPGTSASRGLPFCPNDLGAAPFSLRDPDGAIGEIKKQQEDLIRDLRGKRPRLSVGLGVGLLGDLETARIDTIATPLDSRMRPVPEAAEELSFVYTQRRDRMLFHAFGVWRPTKELEFTADIRFKPRVDPRKRDDVFELVDGVPGDEPTKKLDVRLDMDAGVSYRLGKQLEASAVWEWRADNTPPSIPPHDLADIEFDTTTLDLRPGEQPPYRLDRVAAAYRYTRLLFKIGVVWGQ